MATEKELVDLEAKAKAMGIKVGVCFLCGKQMFDPNKEEVSEMYELSMKHSTEECPALLGMLEGLQKMMMKGEP